MGTGHQRLAEIADITFHGKVAVKVSDYSKANQRFAHDMARELDAAEQAAEAAMIQLKGHPLLGGIDIRIRAWRVARTLREARELVQGISAEMVKFNIQFRTEFLDTAAGGGDRSGKRSDYKGRVDL